MSARRSIKVWTDDGRPNAWGQDTTMQTRDLGRHGRKVLWLSPVALLPEAEREWLLGCDSLLRHLPRHLTLNQAADFLAAEAPQQPEG